MKKIICILLLVMLAACPCFAKKVNRVDAGKQVDLSGYWNDTDARIVSESLIEQALNSGSFMGYKEDLGRRPIITGGSFRNDSSEYIDTSILTEGITTAILNSGKARFIASRKRIEEIREERMARQSWQADMSQQKEVANELIPDLVLTGSVKTIVDTDNKTSLRTYFIYAELVDIETGEMIWRGENKEIKKVIGKK
ncbi:MAG: penicillin-binding protein activator LpoB [Spirochaetia bacterium]|nr:penicillin-binding protein activator LpoB [Spirochaetia bacterium]